MPGGMSFLDMLNAAAAADTITKKKFGEIIKNGTEQEKRDAVKAMNDLGGYENLGDD